jgi:hypothetical protein
MTNKDKLLFEIRSKDYNYFTLVIVNEDMIEYELIEFNVLDADYKAHGIANDYNDDLCLVNTNKIRISRWEKEKSESGSFGK